MLCLLSLLPQRGFSFHPQVADAKVALHLTGLKASSQHDNVVPASTQLGNKSTIAASCVLGEGCVLGDKSSIKRSVLGNNCK